MTQRLFRTSVLGIFIIALLGPSSSRAGDQPEPLPTIAFASTRDIPLPNSPTQEQFAAALEIYLMNPDGSDVRRLTHNQDGDGFPALSPDGKRIVFDSNRNRKSGERLNTSDLFIMKTDGKEQTLLTRGSSASWSPDGKFVVFHASSSGNEEPYRTDPGSATKDSDIFVINVGDCLEDEVACALAGAIKWNLTNTTSLVEDDPDWSPDGQKIVFTSHLSTDNDNDSATAEVFVMNADGTGLIQLTENNEEERAPDWSPDGTRITFLCRPEQQLPAGARPFEICIMNADGSGRKQLTHDSHGPTDSDPTTVRMFHGTAVWSPDGSMIAFHKNVLSQPLTRQIWTMEPKVDAPQTQLTTAPGISHEPNWGVIKTPGQGAIQVAASDNLRRSESTVSGPAVDDRTGYDGMADHGKQGKDKHKKGNKDRKHKGGGKGHSTHHQ